MPSRYAVAGASLANTMTRYESGSANVRAFLRVVDGVGGLARPLLRKRPLRSEPETILLLRCDGIGDLVFSTPAIRAMRERFPHARIDLMVGRWSRDVASLIPGVDRVIVHAPWGYRRLRAARESLSPVEDLTIARRIRRERYDLAVDLRGDLLSIVPMALWRIPVRVGRATRGGEFALTQVVPPPARGHEHEVERTLDVAAALGADVDDPQPRLQLPSAAVDAAEAFFRERGHELARTILVLPGAQWQWRMWPAARFGELSRRLLEDGHSVAIVGARTDESIVQEIAAHAPGSLAVAGGLDLAELAAAIAGCRAFVASESGPAAIASGVDACGVVLFGPGTPAQFGPRAPRIRTIHEPCGERPCFQRGDCQRPGDWCLGRVGVERVLAGVQDALTRAVA